MQQPSKDVAQWQVNGIDLSNFSFHFHAIMTNKDAFQVFFAFQKLEFNTENMMFVQECLDLEQIPYPQQRKEAVQLALHIFDAYIQASAWQSPNKRLLAQLFKSSGQTENHDTWLLEDTYITPFEAFAAIKDAVLLELKTDSFPRFLRSKVWLYFLKSKSQLFIKSLGVPKAATVYDYKDEDFDTNCVVSEIDFRFAERLVDDDYGWELQGRVKSKDGSSTMLSYFSHRMYMPNVSWAKQGSVAKFCCILPYDFDFCTQTLCSFKSIMIFDANAKKYTDHEYLDNATLRAKYPNHVSSSHRAMCRASYDCYFPFPLTTPRRLPVAISLEYKPDEEQLLMVAKPTDLAAPLPKKWFDLRDFHLWMFKRIDKDRTFYCQVHIFNIFGYGTSQKLQKWMIASRGKDMQNVLLTFLKNERDGKHGTVNRNLDDGFASLLQATNVAKRRTEHLQKLEKQNADRRHSWINDTSYL